MAADISFQVRVPHCRVPSSREEFAGRGRLLDRLEGAARVTQISAPAGSGKTSLVRSWLSESGRTGDAAWVSAQGCGQDPGQFWTLVLDAMRDTIAGAELVRPWTGVSGVSGVFGVSGVDGRGAVEWLLADLSSLEEPLYLVIDDLHELRAPRALAELRLLVMYAPPCLRFVLVTREDVRLGLHRLRLAGELTEIRALDLRFTMDEARGMFSAAGVILPEPALAGLVARTEGWAAGLRLAALSLAGHPDPARFAREFSGVERTVAEYLLTEVLDQLSEPARRLLLNTSVCERFSGELADLLSGGSGGEETLRDLEEAGAFVTALDTRRSWFRCHQLFADLLRRELRRTEPEILAELHGVAAGWLAEHGHPAEAIRHAQEAGDWDLAVRLLTDHFLSLVLDAHGAAAHELLARFPAELAADPEVAALAVADELVRASLGEAERHLTRAEQEMTSVPAGRRGRFQLNLAIMRLSLAQRRGDLRAAAEGAQRLLAAELAADGYTPRQCQEMRAVALVNLGTAELRARRAEEAEPHLAEGACLARRSGRPSLEINALTQGAWAASFQSFGLAAKRFLRVIELAEEHGWAGLPLVVPAYAGLSAIRVWQMRLAEAEALIERAEHAVRSEAEPGSGAILHQVRGLMELARGRDAKALTAFQAGERLGGVLVAEHPNAIPVRAYLVQALLRMGEIAQAEQTLAGQDGNGQADVRNAMAVLRLAQDDPRASLAVLAPVLAGSAPATNTGSLTQAYLLEAIGRDDLGDAAGAERALERSLDFAESDGITFPFVIHRAPRLLRRHAHSRTSHAALIAETLSLLGGGGPASAAAPRARSAEPLTESETRILRYLPTNLPAPEIAETLCLSVHTVRTHTRHLYEKLAVHSRTQAVEQARALGLLAPDGGSRKPVPPGRMLG